MRYLDYFKTIWAIFVAFVLFRLFRVICTARAIFALCWLFVHCAICGCSQPMDAAAGSQTPYRIRLASSVMASRH